MASSNSVGSQTKNEAFHSNNSTSGDSSVKFSEVSCSGEPANTSGPVSSASTSYAVSDLKCNLLYSVSLKIDGHPKIEYAALDRESQHTLIDSSLVEELGLRPWPTNTMLGSVRGSGRVSSMVEFEIQSAQNGNRCNLHALVIPNSISINQ